MRLQTAEGLDQHDFEYFKTFKDKQYQGHKRCPTALAWNRQGNLLATAENTIRLWLFSEEHGLDKLTEMTKAHDSNVDWAEFGTPNLLATLSKEAMKFWDIREGKANLLRTQKKGKQDFIRFSWNNAPSEESLSLAVINKDNSVLVYDYRNLSAPLTTITPKSNTSLEYCAASWDRSNSVLFLAGGENNNGSISLFHGQTFQPLTEPIVTHCARITDLCFSQDNEHFATSSEDSLVELHSIPDIICERVFGNKADSSYRRVSFSCQGTYLAASSEGNSIDIFNADKGGLAYKIKSSTSQQVIGWHPKKMVLAYLDEGDKGRSMDRGEESYLHMFYK